MDQYNILTRSRTMANFMLFLEFVSACFQRHLISLVDSDNQRTPRK